MNDLSITETDFREPIFVEKFDDSDPENEKEEDENCKCKLDTCTVEIS